MSIYENLTDNFLAARKLLPDLKWNDQIHANIDEHFENVAVSLYSNPETLSDLVRSDYEMRIDKNVSEIYQSVGLDYPSKFPLPNMIVEAKFKFPLINVFGMALANGDTRKLGNTWSFCLAAIYNEFLRNLLYVPDKQNTLQLCRLLDLIETFENIMSTFGFYGDNYLPLAGLDYFFGDITKRVNKFLTHEDILALSNTAGGPTLVAMHSSTPSTDWLTQQFEIGYSWLCNNPNLPSKTVNRVLAKRELGVSNLLLLHPNASTEDAISWVIEILESGNGEDLLNSMSSWDNVRDDGFNNFNSFRSTSKSGKKVLSAIKKWCRNNPDEGEEIYEMLFEDEI
jgi:hypothetical protein